MANQPTRAAPPVIPVAVAGSTKSPNKKSALSSKNDMSVGMFLNHSSHSN